MKRGEIWTVASPAGRYTGKPRPAIIVQDDSFDGTRSVTVCGLTTDITDTPLIRPTFEPSAENGLKRPSQVMIDKVTTVARTDLGKCIGLLSPSEMVRLNRALFLFLGLAGTRR